MSGRPAATRRCPVIPVPVERLPARLRAEARRTGRLTLVMGDGSTVAIPVRVPAAVAA